MVAKSTLHYSLVCDRCHRETLDEDDYLYASVDEAERWAADRDWLVVDGNHICHTCRLGEIEARSWDEWDAQYATLTSRRLDPSACSHERRSKYDSHVCFDCRALVGPKDEATK